MVVIDCARQQKKKCLNRRCWNRTTWTLTCTKASPEPLSITRTTASTSDPCTAANSKVKLGKQASEWTGMSEFSLWWVKEWVGERNADRLQLVLEHAHRRWWWSIARNKYKLSSLRGRCNGTTQKLTSPRTSPESLSTKRTTAHASTSASESCTDTTSRRQRTKQVFVSVRVSELTEWVWEWERKKLVGLLNAQTHP